MGVFCRPLVYASCGRSIAPSGGGHGALRAGAVRPDFKVGGTVEPHTGVKYLCSHMITRKTRTACGVSVLSEHPGATIRTWEEWWAWLDVGLDMCN